jgi:hypothetical protein
MSHTATWNMLLTNDEDEVLETVNLYKIQK